MNVPSVFRGLALLLALAGGSARADCLPTIEAPWVRAAPPAATVLAGYFTLHNPCAAAVEVVGVESLDVEMPMIHRTEVVGGVSRMRDAGDLIVRPGGRLAFVPGGLHLMLMRPKRALPVGERARIRLVLADGRRVFAEFPVRREAP